MNLLYLTISTNFSNLNCTASSFFRRKVIDRTYSKTLAFLYNRILWRTWNNRTHIRTKNNLVSNFDISSVSSINKDFINIITIINDFSSKKINMLFVSDNLYDLTRQRVKITASLFNKHWSFLCPLSIRCS